MLGKASMLRIRALLADGRFWSGVLAAASLSRGTAFIERPPVGDTVSSGAIEAFISYQTWGIILLMTSLGIALGYMHRSLHPVGIVAHLVSIVAYGTFAISTAVAAIGFGQSWSALGLYFTQVVLHFACSVFLGDEIGRKREVAVE
jgi:hypothetical protein